MKDRDHKSAVGFKEDGTPEIVNSVLHSVVKRFRFEYYSCDKELMVELEASSLNDAMVHFATRYHLIDEVYFIKEVNAS